jgi:hypothetical protein
MPLQADIDRIYLACDPEHVPDWQTACGHIACLPGIVVVEMLKAPARIGSLYLPDEMRMTHWNEDGEPVAGMEPNVGIVLAVGLICQIQTDGETYVSLDSEIKPGDRVIVRDGDGVEVEGFTAGPFKAEGLVRIFGKVIPNAARPDIVEDLPWEESIVARMA